MGIRRLVLGILVMAFAVGCKARKTATIDDVEDLKTAKVILGLYENEPDFRTISARLRTRYDDGKTSQSVTVTLRMEKDETVWMNASFLGISLARAMITPKHVRYYEKVNRSFFDGDFRFLSELLGAELDFKQVERLLLGLPVYDMREGRYLADTQDASYLVAPREQDSRFDLFFYVSPDDFRLQQQRLVERGTGRELTVSYGDYERLGNGWTPRKVRIVAMENGKATEIDINVRSMDRNEEVRFPFSIPNGYKEIEL